MEGFGIITSKLKEMYQMITLGRYPLTHVYFVLPYLFSVRDTVDAKIYSS
jgi:hypothetical protein